MEITMSNRKKEVKIKLAARRKFYETIKRMEKSSFKVNRLNLKLEPNSFRITFAFSPQEMGLDCVPRLEIVEKIGLKRTLERFRPLDFFTEVSIIAQGSPSKENIAKIRAEVLHNARSKFKSDGSLDLASFNTTAGETDEANEKSVTATKL
jgi:hypothetical protein